MVQASAVASSAWPLVMGPVLTTWAPPVQAEKARPAAVQDETLAVQLMSPVAAAWEETPVGLLASLAGAE